MMTLGIDPGTDKSAIAWWDGANQRTRTMANPELLDWMRGVGCSIIPRLVGVERICGTGRAVGRETFETAEMVGRLQEIVEAWPAVCKLVTRHEVLRHLGVMRGAGSADSRVRAALIERIGEPGRQASKGPTYGVTGHEWQALAVAVTVRDGWEKLG